MPGIHPGSCNLAWGLADAVMYLIQTATERTRAANLLARLHRTTNSAAAQALIADALPDRLAAAASSDALESLRKRLLALPEEHARRVLGKDDFIGAVGVFLLVVVATFPVVIPFALVLAHCMSARAKPSVLSRASMFCWKISSGRSPNARESTTRYAQ